MPELIRCKAEPDVTAELFHPLESMVAELSHDELTARLQDARCLTKKACRRGHVMQHHGGDDGVMRSLGAKRVEVLFDQTDVGDVCHGYTSVVEHLSSKVDPDNLCAALCQRLQKHAGAGAHFER